MVKQTEFQAELKQKLNESKVVKNYIEEINNHYSKLLEGQPHEPKTKFDGYLKTLGGDIIEIRKTT